MKMVNFHPSLCQSRAWGLVECIGLQSHLCNPRHGRGFCRFCLQLHPMHWYHIMPDMGGGETFDRLKAIDPEARVLLASGYSADDHAKTILARGDMGFLQKPFTLEAFKKKIEECVA